MEIESKIFRFVYKLIEDTSFMPPPQGRQHEAVHDLPKPIMLDLFLANSQQLEAHHDRLGRKQLKGSLVDFGWHPSQIAILYFVELEGLCVDPIHKFECLHLFLLLSESRDDFSCLVLVEYAGVLPGSFPVAPELLFCDDLIDYGFEQVVS